MKEVVSGSGSQWLVTVIGTIGTFICIIYLRSYRAGSRPHTSKYFLEILIFTFTTS
jgi:hypothetical protein